MKLTAFFMITLADNPILFYNHYTYKGIGTVSYTHLGLHDARRLCYDRHLRLQYIRYQRDSGGLSCYEVFIKEPPPPQEQNGWAGNK